MSLKTKTRIKDSSVDLAWNKEIVIVFTAMKIVDIRWSFQTAMESKCANSSTEDEVNILEKTWSE